MKVPLTKSDLDHCCFRPGPRSLCECAPIKHVDQERSVGGEVRVSVTGYLYQQRWKQFMKELLAVLFGLISTSVGAQSLPDSILNTNWYVEQITTSEHSISSDTIVHWMGGHRLALMIDRSPSKCITDKTPTEYTMQTSICNSCFGQFNMVDYTISVCTFLCKMKLCRGRNGGFSGRGKLEEILIPVLGKTTSIRMQKNEMKLIAEDGSEVLLRK